MTSAVQAVGVVVLLPPGSLGYESASVRPVPLVPTPPPTAFWRAVVLPGSSGQTVVHGLVPAVAMLPEFDEVVVRFRLEPAGP